MRRFLVASILLVGCGCAQQPIVPEAQPLLQSMQSSYTLAHKVEQKYCSMEKLPQPCIAVRQMGYNFEAAYTTAIGERTDRAIVEARLQLIAYETAALELL